MIDPAPTILAERPELGTKADTISSPALTHGASPNVSFGQIAGGLHVQSLRQQGSHSRFVTATDEILRCDADLCMQV